MNKAKQYFLCSLFGFSISLFLTLPISAQTQLTSQSVVVYNAIGPVKVGMSVPQASKALGGLFLKERDEVEGCYYVVPKGGPKGVSFMVTNRRIARIDIDDRPFATERGARIGDSEKRIQSLYKGEVKVTPHPYDDNGHYFTVAIKGTRFQLIFETDGKRVTSYRVGKLPEVGYIEGCL